MASLLQAEVDTLAAKHKGAPRFQPHVTLLGGIEQGEAQVLEAAATLAADLQVSRRLPAAHTCRSLLSPKIESAHPSCPLQPYHIDFERVAYGAIFHQCVYLLGRKGEATMRVSRLGAPAHSAFVGDGGLHAYSLSGCSVSTC